MAHAQHTAPAKAFRGRRTMRAGIATVAALSAAFGVAACNRGSSSDAAGGGEAPVGVVLITKDSTNPFFVAMQKGAKADAAKNNVKLTVASGKQEGDDQGQITAIEDAIARGDKGILITPMSTGVNAAIKKARDAGLYVIALDTPPDPAETVDITFATDNREAGKLDGQWAASTLDGKAATIALLDLFSDKIVSVDYDRDQGFLEGMGIDVKDPKKNGDEAKTGKYTGGKGGDYTIVCNEAGQAPRTAAAPRWRSASPRTRTSTSSTRSTSPPPSAPTRRSRPRARRPSSCRSTAAAPASPGEERGDRCDRAAVPPEDGHEGMEAIAKVARGGEKPTPDPGLAFKNTGVALVTDKPVEGVESITSAEGAKLCWGN